MDRITNFIDRITKLPGQIGRKSDELNDKLISIGEDLQNAVNNSATVAESNLRQNKIESLGTDAARWISRPNNLILTAGIIIGTLILVRVIGK